MKRLFCTRHRGWGNDATGSRSVCPLFHGLIRYSHSHLDTGSSDLWVMSDTCLLGCAGGPRLYPQASFSYSGVDVALLYGDSTTGTFAKGTIGEDTVEVAGVSLPRQYFAAINATNTSLGETGSAGIFGLGFPVNRCVLTHIEKFGI